jgi:fatty-acyl-CoA synthase
VPVTAIGKVYKPALRAIAYERAASEQLTSNGLDRVVRARVEEAASGLTLRFVIDISADRQAIEVALSRLMQPFAIRWEVAA